MMEWLFPADPRQEMHFVWLLLALAVAVVLGVAAAIRDVRRASRTGRVARWSTFERRKNMR